MAVDFLFFDFCKDAVCQARIESLEQEIRSLKELPRPNPSGRMSEPQERASYLLSLTSSTPTSKAWENAETATLRTFRPELATEHHSVKLAELAKQKQARLSTVKTAAFHYDTHTDSATVRMPYEKQEHCAFFAKLPLELRKSIYRHLLVSNETITPDWQVVGEKRGFFLELNGVDYTPARGLDATILQSCEAVYHEAYSFLYDENVFEFHDAYELYYFRLRGIMSIYGRSCSDSNTHWAFD